MTMEIAMMNDSPGASLERQMRSQHPPEGMAIGGRTLLFLWDANDLAKRPNEYELTIKRRMPGQTLEAAFASNEPVVQTRIQRVSFFVLDLGKLGAASAFVWKAAALDGGLESTPLQSFTTERDLKLLRVVSSGTPRTRKPEAAPRSGARSEACPNGDLEYGNLQGWTGYSGTRSNAATVELTTVQSGFVNDKHTIRSASDGYDPYLGGPLLRQVNEGQHSVRIGSSTPGSDAFLLSYTFTVTAQNRWFGFRYAIVLDNPQDHEHWELPFFGYYIVKGSSMLMASGEQPVSWGGVMGNEVNPFVKRIGDRIYRDWTPVCVDLSQYEGQTMTALFWAAGCSQGGHCGYAYIDGLCKSNAALSVLNMPDRACGNAAIMATGADSQNGTSHYWSLEESDVNGGRNPGTEVWHWWPTDKPGGIDLAAFYEAKAGKKLKCNTYYRVKLGVLNDCSPPHYTERLLYVACPIVTGGPPVCVPCQPNGTKTTLGIGNPATAGTTYAWTPATGLDDPSSPSPRHTNGSVPYPRTYLVTARDVSGCTNAAYVTLYCQKPTLWLSEKSDCCLSTLTAQVEGAESVKWSTGATTLSIQVKEGTYTCTATNPCGSTTETITVTSASSFTGPFHPVAVNRNVGVPSGIPGTSFTDKMYVKDQLGGGYGAPNAYNATRYRLEIYGRIGLIRTISGENCNGFPNYSIAWDGKDEFGAYVKEDAYTWLLYFGNCQYGGLRPAIIRNYTERRCVDWATFLGMKLWCKAYNVPPGTYEDKPNGAGIVVIAH